MNVQSPGAHIIYTAVNKLFKIAYDRNSLNYPFPSEFMKNTQSGIVVVIGGNVETVLSVFYS